MTATIETISKAFSTKEAANYLGCSTRLLWTLTNSGAIACFRVGRLVRYEQTDLDAFKARNRTEAKR